MINRKTILLNEHLSITILIPFRNELLRFGDLLKSLQELDDSNCNLYVTFINDHSNDGSQDYLKEWALNTNKKTSILKLENNVFGKKAAIELGVNNASSDWIFTLDADSYLDADFLLEFQSKMIKGKELYLLPVREFGNGVFLSKIESSILSSITFSCLGLNWPLLSNGTGMIYKRVRFLELNPYADNSKLLSGDDLFLLDKMVAYNRSLISGFNQQALTVYTSGPLTYKEMIFRAVRWAAKMKNSSKTDTSFVGLVVLLCNLSLIPICVYHLYNSYLFSLFYLFVVKFIFDVLLLSLNKSFSFTIKSIAYMMLTYLFYPFHLLVVFSCSIFSTVNWKGRSI